MDLESGPDGMLPAPPDAAPVPDQAVLPPPMDAGPQIEGVANNECAGAIRIEADGTQIIRGDTSEADATLFGIPDPGEWGPDVWYGFVLDATTEVTLDIVADGDWDTYLFVYGGGCDGLEWVAENDDANGAGLNSRLTQVMPRGRYAVRVAGFDEDEFGPFTLTATFSEPVAFDDAIFGATHNSYSGGARRSIEAQLDQGIRLLEFDVHDDDYQNRGDFRIGHERPGDEVDHNPPNPPDDALTGWLLTVAEWSLENEGHSPITVVLDMKDNVANNHRFSEGNLAALNNKIAATMDRQLLAALTVPPRGGGWPSVGELRGRILVVISGDEASRRGYRDDEGFRPAVALNTLGHVVEVHDDGDDTLWYWHGRYASATDTVVWLNHGRYDTGIDPAVAVDQNGVVVEVHKHQGRSRLYYRVGRISEDGRGVDWNSSHDYDDGILPTIQFIGPSRVREIHQSQNNRQRWYREGVINVVEGTIDWQAHGRTDDAMPDKTQAQASINGRIRRVEVRRRDADNRLRYRTDDGPDAPIQYPQLAFVEGQQGDDWIGDDIRFFAAESGGEGDEFLREWMNRGGVARQWHYDEVNPDLVSQFPATNVPFAQWYVDHLEALDAVAP